MACEPFTLALASNRISLGAAAVLFTFTPADFSSPWARHSARVGRVSCGRTHLRDGKLVYQRLRPLPQPAPAPTQVVGLALLRALPTCWHSRIVGSIHGCAPFAP